MNVRSLRGLALLTGLLLSVPSYAHHLAVIVAKDSKVDSITSADLKKMVKSETRRWPNGNEVTVVLVRNSPVTLSVLQNLCHMTEAGLKAHIAAHKESIVVVDSDDELLKIVEARPGALGLVDVHAIHDKRFQVLKVDNRLPLDQGYLPH